MGCTGKTFLSRGSSQQLPLKYQSWVDSVASSLQKNKLLPMPLLLLQYRKQSKCPSSYSNAEASP